MKTKTAVKKAVTPKAVLSAAQIEVLRADLKWMEERVDDLAAKNAKLATKCDDNKLMRTAIYDSLVQERHDLMARTLRIDQRILALGFLVPTEQTLSASAALLRKQKG